MELSVCLSPLIHGELGRSSHRPASPCPAGGGSAGIRLYSQAKRCDAHHTEPPEEGTDTGGEHKPESSAEVWQAGSEGDQKVTHPSHTFFFEIWRGGRGENRHPAVPAPPPGSRAAASPPRRDCGRVGMGDPRPRRSRREGGPGEGGKRAGRGGGGGARAAGASSLLHCRGAIFPRLGLRGGSAGPDHRPPGTALPRGHCASRGGAPATAPHTCATPARSPALLRGDTPAQQPGGASLPGGRPCSPAAGPRPQPPPHRGMPRGRPPAACLLVGEAPFPQPQGGAAAPAVRPQQRPRTPARCGPKLRGQRPPRQPNRRREPDTRSGAEPAPAPAAPARSLPDVPAAPGSPLLLFGEGGAAAARDGAPLGKQPAAAPPRPSPRRGGGCGQTKLRRSGGGWRRSPRPQLPAPLTSRARAAPAASSRTAKWGSIAAAGSGEGGRKEGKEGCRPAGRGGVRL